MMNKRINITLSFLVIMLTNLHAQTGLNSVAKNQISEEQFIDKSKPIQHGNHFFFTFISHHVDIRPCRFGTKYHQ